VAIESEVVIHSLNDLASRMATLQHLAGSAISLSGSGECAAAILIAIDRMAGCAGELAERTVELAGDPSGIMPSVQWLHGPRVVKALQALEEAAGEVQPA
jgi:hypothetical protein